MFYAHNLLSMSKKGPLAKVWMAAHMDRKLNKAFIAQIDMKQVVGK